MSLPEEDRLRLEFMLESITLIRTWTADLDEAAFLNDSRTQSAVAMRLLVLGETAKRVTTEVRERAPDVAWRILIGLRNRIAHGYDSVDFKIVWTILANELQPLSQSITRLLLLASDT